MLDKEADPVGWFARIVDSLGFYHRHFLAGEAQSKVLGTSMHPLDESHQDQYYKQDKVKPQKVESYLNRFRYFDSRHIRFLIRASRGARCPS